MRNKTDEGRHALCQVTVKIREVFLVSPEAYMAFRGYLFWTKDMQFLSVL